MQNVNIRDNGSAYLIEVDGLTVHATNSLGDAWRRIVWMYYVAQQQFTVGKKNPIPAKEWVKHIEEIM